MKLPPWIRPLFRRSPRANHLLDPLAGRVAKGSRLPGGAKSSRLVEADGGGGPRIDFERDRASRSGAFYPREGFIQETPRDALSPLLRCDPHRKDAKRPVNPGCRYDPNESVCRVDGGPGCRGGGGRVSNDALLPLILGESSLTGERRAERPRFSRECPQPNVTKERPVSRLDLSSPDLGGRGRHEAWIEIDAISHLRPSPRSESTGRERARRSHFGLPESATGRLPIRSAPRPWDRRDGDSRQDLRQRFLRGRNRPCCRRAQGVPR